MDRAAQVQWLQQNTILGALSTEVLAAIAAQVQEESIPENYRLILENTYPQAFYFLYSGRLESYRSRKTDVADVLSLLPGTVLNLKELLLDQPVERTVITLSDCSFWKVSREAFVALAEQYPEINRAVSLQLAEELAQVSSQLAFEQERQVRLRSYLVPKAKRGIVGSSRYAKRLREDIQKASADRLPVIIFGEPGLNKDNIAALIQFGSCDRREPLIKIDGDQLKADGAELFGQIGGDLGLLGWLGKGTLILNNAQEIPPGLQDKLAALLKTGTYTPVGLSQDEAEEHKPLHSQARIIITTEKQLPRLDCKNLIGHWIKVTPLRVRKTDIAAQVQYYVSVFCRERGIPRPRVTPEVIRRLQSYDFPNNLSELESLIARALIQANGAKELTEAVFWSMSSKTKRFRLNLLNAFPQLRQFLRSSWWPDRINYGLVLPLFPVVVFILFWGPQDRAHNIGLNLFWAWWWPVVLFLFPFLGRVWCAVCPFMIYGEVIQKLSLWLFPRKLKA
ncbi:MAG: sigma 54-interacting transcriptional regulator [Gloeobacterales cyanobacterium]